MSPKRLAEDVAPKPPADARADASGPGWYTSGRQDLCLGGREVDRIERWGSSASADMQPPTQTPPTGTRVDESGPGWYKSGGKTYVWTGEWVELSPPPTVPAGPPLTKEERDKAALPGEVKRSHAWGFRAVVWEYNITDPMGLHYWHYRRLCGTGTRTNPRELRSE